MERSVRTVRVFVRHVFSAGLLTTFLLSINLPLHAQNDLPPVTVGAGVQTSLVSTHPDQGSSSQRFLLNSARIYLGGSATEKIKFMFNTEYDGVTNKVGILDAVARMEMSSKFNVWAGRLLPPSDRANLYGPYYSHHWLTFTDGIQDGYPFIHAGRNNGAVYWGDFGKAKISAGAFDGMSLTGNPKLLGAARVQIDFWDKENGYYLNGTYYGDKNLLGLGGAVQVQSGNTAATGDFLLERKLPNNGVVTLESEYAFYDKLGGYDAKYGRSQGAYVLAAYLFPQQVGVGKFEILGKYAAAKFSNGITPANGTYGQRTSEVNFNYVIKQFNARVMIFFQNTEFTAVKTDFKQAGVGLQIQM
jgi:hypothetical protein